MYIHTYMFRRIHTHFFFNVSTLKKKYVSIRQHTSAYVSIRQHTSAYVSIRQHMSAYVSIRQHTAAYVSIPQASFRLSITQHTSAYLKASFRLCQRGALIRPARLYLLRLYEGSIKALSSIKAQLRLY
jgi:hypothetical protein